MLYHYVDYDYYDGKLGGVPRADFELHKVFPDMITISKKRTLYMPTFTSHDIVITGNDMVLEIPNHITCISIAHGIAETHKIREPSWNGDSYVRGQRMMKYRPNTYFIATSSFTEDEFISKLGIVPYTKIIHAVDTRPIAMPIIDTSKKINVIGDWRNFNKGSEVIKRLNSDKYNFISLKCGPYDKAEAYSKGHIYLTLSLSEGCSYAQLDALACGLPVLSTNVSIFYKDTDKRCGEVISWTDRDKLDIIITNLDYIVNNYNKYDPIAWVNKNISFDNWKDKWTNLIKEITK